MRSPRSSASMFSCTTRDVGTCFFDERRTQRPATDGLQTERPGASKEIDRVRSFGVGRDQIKNRLPHSIFHRTGLRIAMINQLASTIVSADDPQLGRRMLWF